ncbi:MAG: hypothetical protein WCF67_11590 [Chitinophagaceae bacterium]
MDYDKIRALLKKYWDGDTDLSEEQELKSFFAEHTDLPEDLKTEAGLFGYYRQEVSRPVLSEDITTKLRAQWANEKKSVFNKASFGRGLLRYAAVLAPLVLIGYFVVREKKVEERIVIQTDTFNDPQQAIAETEKALLLLSRNMNDGLSEMETIRGFEEVKNTSKLK